MCSGDFDLWIHLHCWEVKNPQIVQLFGGINNNRILRAFSEAIAGGLLQGWQQLQCNQRYQVLSHIFYTNQSFTLTARDIITHFKCAKPGCTFCQHPNDCSYHSIQKCIHPELPLIKCRNDACDNVMHDGCVIGFQYSFGLEEQRPFVCFGCHPGDRNLFTSSTQQRDDTERHTASASTEASSNERSPQVRFPNMTQGVEEASCVMSELSLRAPEGASACSWRAPSRRCEETTGRSSGC